ncbi:MAG: hypothetical protein Q7V01_02100 [Vicinamibacterales bacterium]|nr:hypothetical protein [Vicinamibacterales bacterium]
MSAGILLLGADYYGTLAAVRTLGRRGIRVTVADEHRHARAMWSRYAAETAVHPPLGDPAALIEWLLAWGGAHPGTVLYPTNDHLAWLFARYRDVLGPVFQMHSPSADAVIALLDKQRLHEACASADVGIEVPRTFSLRAADGTDVDGATLPFPLLLKPRTQVLLESGIKGVLVADRDQLASGLARFRRLVSFNRELSDRYPDVGEPLLQEYLAAAETAIVSVSGYVDAQGHVVARGAQKVLQRPRRLGIGLCFEGRPVDPVLVGKIGALCRRVGYFGTFEAEFIADGERRLLIDFNPRFYSQMAFDIDRGLDLPLIVWHAARNDRPALSAELAAARSWMPTGHEAYSHTSMLALVLTAQRLSGRMSAADARRWRAWHAQRRGTLTDAVRDASDRRPAVVDAAAWLRSFARHPRGFVRNFVLNET